MDPVAKPFNVIFNPVRNNNENAHQDAERKVVAFIQGTVTVKIKNDLREVLAKDKTINSEEAIAQKMKTNVDGNVLINTEMTACTACSGAISKLRGMFSPELVSVIVNHGVEYHER